MLTVDWSCPGYNGVDGQVPRLSETEREQLRHSLPGTALHHGKENKDTSIPAMLHLRDNPHFVFLPLASSLSPSPSPLPIPPPLSIHMQGLSGRPDEPSTCAVQYLKEISELFQFYYHSPSAVLKVNTVLIGQ